MSNECHSVKSSAYYFDVRTKILANFQISISVLLTMAFYQVVFYITKKLVQK